MMKSIVVLAAGAVLLAGCSSATPGKGTSAVSSPAPLPTLPTDTPPAPDPTTAAPQGPESLALGQSLSLQSGSADNTFDVTLNKVLAAATLRGTSDRYLGLSVTIGSVTGAPDYQSVQFGLQPATESSGDGGLESGDLGRLNRAACAGIGMLDGELDIGGATDDGAGDLTLADGMSDMTGCVVVNYSAKNKPTRVIFADQDPTVTGFKVLGSWPVALPRVQYLTKPPPPAITYKVFGNGSQASTITYTEGANSSIEQSTGASLPWTKKVSPDGSFFSVDAQDDNGTSITCEILDVDGSVLDKHTAHGLYAIASCQSA